MDQDIVGVPRNDTARHIRHAARAGMDVAVKATRSIPSRSTLYEYGSLLVVLLVMSLLFLRDITNRSLYYPDADRIRMDGVFILDFFRSMPLGRVYEFTTQYYVHYPAISIGYRPPFVPMVEAVFNGLFGVNVWSSRLAILLFVVVGVTLWWKLLARIFDRSTAFWACLLLVTTPIVVQGGWYTMNDVPVMALTMTLAYVFYCSRETPKYMAAAAVVLLLALLTKQTAMFLIPWLGTHLAVRRQLSTFFVRRAAVLTLITAGTFTLVFLVLITVSLGSYNVMQSIGLGHELNPLSRLAWSNLMWYPESLPQQLTFPVIALSGIGMIGALWKRDRRLIYFTSMILCTYLFFTYLIAKDSRYTTFWLPALVLFATLPLSYLAGPWRTALAGAFTLLVVYQIVVVSRQQPAYATGYDEAAAYIVEHREAAMMLFDGANNGSFTYFVRALDPDRTMFVLRADKLLTSSVLSPNMWLQEHVHDRAGIRDLLDRFGVVHVVVERDDYGKRRIHEELRAYLATGPFRLVKEIAVASNWRHLNGQTLRIYKYLDAKPRTARDITLRLPLVGKTINVPLPREMAR